MSLEYLEGFSNHGDTADVWILRDEGGKFSQIVHSLLTHRDGGMWYYIITERNKPIPRASGVHYNRQKGKQHGKYHEG